MERSNFVENLSFNMKVMSFSFIAMLALAIACNKGEATENPTTANAKKLEGKWTLVKTDINLKFDDGTTQNISLPGSTNDYIELKFVKKDGTEESGTIKNVFMGDESTGDWVYTDGDKSLDITYTSMTPHFYLFRTVQTVNADDAQVLNQYKLNDLDDLGNKKLIGGSVREEWKK
jgi:hypothetical protein